MSPDVFTFTNASGIEVRAMAYGGVILSIRAPDRNGVFADVTPGYDTPEEYVRAGRFFGALVGRYANRIAGARITVDGVEYELDRNDGPNQLHGGHHGFHNRVWQMAAFDHGPASGAVLSCVSEAGDQGFPGTLNTRVTYTLADDDSFTIDYSATTDATTPVNFTQHTYFNLAGQDSGDILAHELTLNAAAFTPVDGTLIPTGEIRPVHGTPFDFTAPRTIGEAITGHDDQLRIAGGFDHNFVINSDAAGARVPAATVYEPRSGRVLDVYTTQPGVQFYSGNGLGGGAPGKNGHQYSRYAALALETQHFPDSPHHPEFPSTLLRPGEEFRSRTIWKFSTRPAGD